MSVGWGADRKGEIMTRERFRAWLQEKREVSGQRWRLIGFLRAASPALAALSVVFAFVAGLLPVTLIVAGGLLTARIQQAIAAHAGPAAMAGLYRAFAPVTVLFLAAEVMVPVQRRLRWLLIKRVDRHVRERVMRAGLTGTDLSRFHDEELGRSMFRAANLATSAYSPGNAAAGMLGVTRDYVAFQDFARLEVLARESVGVGDVGRVDDRGAVRRALRRADVSDLEGDLPGGLETPLGHARSR